ncbi:Aldehyde Dehydrogenase [Pseudarthrobacter chlorophenolicus A6]|uniref:Aldehyde Dehydrogenase n=1 Tax=Pseudarthrobacter chlorophenolicus (strain ATCC 700700 / DSM 12829 / CIP 107037 / JCM 12360 / KCTC 9906 / NCIMB 13794 / A6) TaxID=452863 RepID=B8H6P6_PSECP|nr:aldehyde dehydrogenase family protein [Pseudarthrobacter chlorophenolicus]ACL41572.1 Aldehyde Dehydrogenase [Pseudarthrobacter chlorophenolicus A6]SDQ61890.1 phenylacetaldehyde dehydrogenase [Pseudarthrobacter chlorophenolicus]
METYDALLAAISSAPGTGRTILDPATGAAVGEAPVHGVADLEAAITAAAAAQPAWAALGHDARSAVLLKAADAVERSAEELAQLLSREQGKPLNGPNARFEVGACAAWLRAAAGTPLAPETLVDDGETRADLHYRPIGVVGAIGPWNWPMMITTWQVAPALRMGNTVVVKPSEYTPLSVLALAKVLNEELPEGLLTVVSGGRDVGEALASHQSIGKVMFTGSTATGKAIIRSSADTVKRLTLELGGNDAGIVLPGTDPRAIAQDLFWGAFINTGQTCAALKRLYVHDSIYDAVCEALTDVAKAMPMGNGLDENNVLGPLQNKAQYDVVANLVEAARASGARVLLGGNPDSSRPGYFYPATLVADIDNGNPLVAEEQFGPALPIIRYGSIDEAVEMANDLDVGLGASVWSSDPAAARAVAARLEAGTVWINRHGAVDPRIPFGGAKQSGYGLEFGAEGLKALGVPQVING